MKNRLRYVAIAAIAMLPALTASAQSAISEKLAIKATADIGLGGAMSVSSELPGMSTKSSSSDFGLGLGWTFWKMGPNSLEANIGFGFGKTSVTADLPELDYHYSAPAAADMDDEPYIRYYQLSDLHQKISASKVVVPIYLNYRYEINNTVSVHALLGIKPTFYSSAKVGESTGSAFSYGIYPQYDDLLIDATYLNEFGTTSLASASTAKPETAGAISFMAGAGAEVRISGPVYFGLTLRYETGGNTFKKAIATGTTFTADNAPVTYTVAEGQKVNPLTSYLTSSKLSRLSLALSLTYRF